MAESALFGEGSVAEAPDVTPTTGGRLTYSRLSGSSEGIEVVTAFRANRGARRRLGSPLASLLGGGGLTLFCRLQQASARADGRYGATSSNRFDGDPTLTVEAG